MSVIFFLVIVGIIVAGGFLVAFVWSVKSGQYDDTYSPAVRMLFDDTKIVSSTEQEGEKPEKDNKKKPEK